jgi:hypothetical protein
MRWSKCFIPTLRESPAGVESRRRKAAGAGRLYSPDFGRRPWIPAARRAIRWRTGVTPQCGRRGGSCERGLLKLTAKYPDSEVECLDWYRIANAATWTRFADIRADGHDGEGIADRDECVQSGAGGNGDGGRSDMALRPANSASAEYSTWFTTRCRTYSQRQRRSKKSIWKGS